MPFDPTRFRLWSDSDDCEPIQWVCSQRLCPQLWMVQNIFGVGKQNLSLYWYLETTSCCYTQTTKKGKSFYRNAYHTINGCVCGQRVENQLLTNNFSFTWNPNYPHNLLPNFDSRCACANCECVRVCWWCKLTFLLICLLAYLLARNSESAERSVCVCVRFNTKNARTSVRLRPMSTLYFRTICNLFNNIPSSGISSILIGIVPLDFER